MESQRQLKFLVMLRQPQLPAQPEASWRWKAFLASLGGLLVVWGVGGFLVGVVRRA
jgi:capsular polysaccharide transport system permease protein